MSKKYEESGVSLKAGYDSVELIKKHVARTKNLGMLSTIGSFGGCFDLGAYKFKNPVLVSGTDGVGTKLKLAFELNIHNTIGIDVVAMCVNDILAQGAIPLFFLDYLAVGKNYPKQIEEIVSGVAEGCVQAGCAIVGGETAEMAGFYEDGEYDIAGFCVGAQEKELLLNPINTKAGQIAIGLPSSGVHSNGFSLIRKILKDNNISLYEKFEDSTVGEVLLTPTKIYAKEVLIVLEKIKVAGISHITGGGFYENLPRCLDKGLGMKINKNSYKVPKIFHYLQEKGNIDEKDMYNIFNMGVGLVLIVDKKDVEEALSLLNNAFVLGEVTNSGEIEIL
ncbi:phosphoribosylformylglycinamidine cyclo-ligase [Gemella sp. GH3]|uniref:phosphoribosylformylglycinamidine cyclo-ligase n=1 Tax=unclassified Gemella TaxID=2624949 RepID=UPI0015CF903E|nr:MULTISPECIES: phosphoribosylformylglycinamidine cyclo-ligase [unclassified Gemella]MBF0713769.1 phosphoribosylformylglycinamidine cyclo-ligase [Gemella sp. GH3.1]NYS50721.1 phosphoribosylformylglycinamidine cyclo-ligase [Gemella sp. GH3]